MSKQISSSEQPHRVMTAFGPVEVSFVEVQANQFTGEAAVVSWLRAAIGGMTNGEGITMNPDTVSPYDFTDFCQPSGSGIFILPPAHALIARSDDDSQATEEPEED